MKQANTPVKKNDELSVDIIDLSYEGLGVAKVNDYPIFVTDALPGEKCLIHITKTQRNYGYAKVIERLNDAPERAYFDDQALLKTGTLPLVHLNYDAQLAFKQEQLIHNLHREHLDELVTVPPTLGMADPWHYRNKAQVPIGGEVGALYTGFYRRRSHDIIPLTDYRIQSETIDDTLQKVIEILNKYNLAPYDERKHQGLVRHLVVREGYLSREQMIILVINGEKLPHEDEIVAEIRQNVPQLTSFVLNQNTARTNVILGKHERLLYGQPYYTDELKGLTFRISPQSFYQVNSAQTEVLYDQVLKNVGLTGNEVVIDAYCGIGTITLALAQHAKHVYGVEIVEQAIEMAKENAALNGIDNVTLTADRAEDCMPRWVEQGIQPDVVVVDPPRKGLAQPFIDSVLDVKPDKLIYVSCNPSTLARDLRKFVDGGYTINSVQPVDMFPQTNHIESVTVLTRE
ncbi:MAG: 23S rRNA (uracil(1939)-C(5))-methyltransferase RlmD [Aerococcus sp.]|nr:23S rRNA (uracil(1939)-C(5))-methyltransferase RlmD [Aerococcus sp.]